MQTQDQILNGEDTITIQNYITSPDFAKIDF